MNMSRKRASNASSLANQSDGPASRQNATTRSAAIGTSLLASLFMSLPEKSPRLRAQFRPIELFLELMEGIVADLFGLAQLQNAAPCRGERAPTQRVGRQFAAGDAAV